MSEQVAPVMALRRSIEPTGIDVRRVGGAVASVRLRMVEAAELVQVPSTVKPATARALLRFAGDVLKPFGLDTQTYKAEVLYFEDEDRFTVNMQNAQGARLAVEGMWMSTNRRGVLGYHQLGAYLD